MVYNSTNTEVYKEEPTVTEVKPPLNKGENQINLLIKRVLEQINPYLNQYKSKFEKLDRKKVLMISAISLVILLIILAIGVLLKQNGVSKSPTPTPSSQENTEGQVGPESTDSKLKSLRDQLTTFDLDDPSLTPPDLNFNIKF